MAKHADATLNDIVLTLCSGTLRTYLDTRNALPTDPLIAMVPVSLRTPDSDTDSARPAAGGNRVGTLMCNLATHLPDPGHRLDTVRTSMREGKAALRAMSPAQALAMSALGAAPLGLEMLLGRRGPLRPPFNVVISNLAGPRTPLYWNGARLDALYPISIPTTGQALNITCTSSEDQIAFGLTGCRRALPDLNPMLQHLDTELDLLESGSDERRTPVSDRREQNTMNTPAPAHVSPHSRPRTAAAISTAEIKARIEAMFDHEPARRSTPPPRRTLDWRLFPPESWDDQSTADPDAVAAITARGRQSAIPDTEDHRRAPREACSRPAGTQHAKCAGTEVLAHFPFLGAVHTTRRAFIPSKTGATRTTSPVVGAWTICPFPT